MSRVRNDAGREERGGAGAASAPGRRTFLSAASPERNPTLPFSLAPSRSSSAADRNVRGPQRIWAFTLIELLVVIAIMAILASMIFPVTAAVKRIRIRRVAQAELKQIETAIEKYKLDKGFYP